jgi:hypothetical protein
MWEVVRDGRQCGQEESVPEERQNVGREAECGKRGSVREERQKCGKRGSVWE